MQRGHRRARHRQTGEVRVVELGDETTVENTGAVRSIQAAKLELPVRRLDSIWSPMYLERLARTYWRYLTRISLGLIRVIYTPQERRVVLLSRRLTLLRFYAPEYELEPDTGVVIWRIKSGVLVQRRYGESGYLRIAVKRKRQPLTEKDRTVALVEVEVANFYPAIASAISTWAYKVTQAKIHVIITHGFLRSLARLDLAESRVGVLKSGQ